MTKKIIIIIGRQFGSGGKDVARELGRKLSIPVYDGELINKAAQESGLSPEYLRQNDEKKRFTLTSIFTNALACGDGDFSSGGQIFNIQSEVIKKIAGQGSAVIVGRCADYILRDHDCLLSVFITSPLKDRMKRTCERGESTPEEVENFVNKKDKGREDYYNCYSFRNWGTASNYDICLDSSILGIEGTADMIIEFAEKAGMLK